MPKFKSSRFKPNLEDYSQIEMEDDKVETPVCYVMNDSVNDARLETKFAWKSNIVNNLWITKKVSDYLHEAYHSYYNSRVVKTDIVPFIYIDNYPEVSFGTFLMEDYSDFYDGESSIIVNPDLFVNWSGAPHLYDNRQEQKEFEDNYLIHLALTVLWAAPKYELVNETTVKALEDVIGILRNHVCLREGEVGLTAYFVLEKLYDHCVLLEKFRQETAEKKTKTNKYKRECGLIIEKSGVFE